MVRPVSYSNTVGGSFPAFDEGVVRAGSRLGHCTVSFGSSTVVIGAHGSLDYNVSIKAFVLYYVDLG